MGAIVGNPTDTGCKVKHYRGAIYRLPGLVKRGQVGAAYFNLTIEM